MLSTVPLHSALEALSTRERPSSARKTRHAAADLMPPSYWAGVEHKARAAAYRRRLNYEDAVSEAHASLHAFYAAAANLTLSDTSATFAGGLSPAAAARDTLAAAVSELAELIAEAGNLPLAIRISAELMRSIAVAAHPSRQALAYNTDAQLRIRAGDLAGAEAALDRAEALADRVEHVTLRSAVLLTRARLARLRLNAVGQRPLPHGEAFYDQLDELLRGDHAALACVSHERARFLRSLAERYSDAGAHELAARTRNAALRALDRAATALACTPDNDLASTELLQTRMSLLISLGLLSEARGCADALENLLQRPLPPYGQILCGKLALQLARLELAAPWPNVRKALCLLTIALARSAVFGPRHREQYTLVRLVHNLICVAVPPAALQSYCQQLCHELCAVRLEMLPYQREQLTLHRWSEAWEQAVQHLIELQDATLVTGT